MKYKNAAHVLPDELLKEVQKYVTGEAIYIPKQEEKRKWGEGSGARQFYRERNERIRTDYEGACIISACRLPDGRDEV